LGKIHGEPTGAEIMPKLLSEQLLIHAVSGAQMKFALKIVEDVDRTGFGARELHRFGNDGGEHGFEIKIRCEIENKIVFFVAAGKEYDEAKSLIAGIHENRFC
jgi:hypothetical protein